MPEQDDDMPEAAQEVFIPPAEPVDTARTLVPMQMFGVDAPVDKDFRPLPVDSADLEVSATDPKGLSVVESADSSPTQEDLLTLMESSHSSPEQPEATAPAVKATGTPSPVVPSSPTTSAAQKAG